LIEVLLLADTMTNEQQDIFLDFGIVLDIASSSYIKTI